VKLRLRGSSLRLRLTRGEVDAIGRGERVEEVVDFAPGERLIYALECGGEAVAASFSGGSITVRVPPSLGREWSTTERVGIEAEQVSVDWTLRILIEKDFACLVSRVGEDDHDAFPNPGETCGDKPA
jgi:hypothetical protein